MTESARATPAKRGARSRHRRGQQAVGAVDVEPDIGGPGHVGQLVQRVDGPGVGRSGRAHDGHRQDARLTVGRDGVGDGVDVHPLVVVHRDGMHRVPPEAEHGR